MNLKQSPQSSVQLPGDPIPGPEGEVLLTLSLHIKPDQRHRRGYVHGEHGA